MDVSTQDLKPWPDQWAFLSGIQRLTPARLEALLETVPPVEAGPGKPLSATPAAKARYPAATFEACMRDVSARYILGLTATPYPRDGLKEIITMQCGPARYRMPERRSGLLLKLQIRETGFALPPEADLPIQQVFGSLVADESRNALIERDVLAALSRGRRCLILSHRREHCRLLAEKLTRKGKTPFTLNGSQGKKERAAILKAIQETPPDKDLAVVATGQYLGEGFDCPSLDTLFLAFPVALKGKLVQYAGRVMRELPGKATAEIYDYVDVQVPVLKHMFFRRRRAYKALGFAPAASASLNGGEPLLP